MLSKGNSIANKFTTSYGENYMGRKSIYKIVFMNQSKIYEIYVNEVCSSNIHGFIEVSGLIFGEKSALLIDPSEERLKNEFQEVKRSYIPLHLIIRIDEVEKGGVAKIVQLKGKEGFVPSIPTDLMKTTDEEFNKDI
jgi:hypothetical protein